MWVDDSIEADDECPLPAQQQRLVEELVMEFDETIQAEPTVEAGIRALRKLQTGDPVIDQEVCELAGLAMWLWTVYRPAVLLKKN